MKKIDLSVIIPAYNVEEYIGETIDSFLCQKTSFSFEILIINDGSTDNTFNIIKKYECVNENIYIFDQNNSGLGATRNKGIQHATGEYIFFCDSDDYVAEDFIENCLLKIKENKLDLLLFSGESFLDDGYVDYVFSPFYSRKETGVLSGKKYISFAEKEKNYFVSACMYITRLDHLKNHKFFFPENILYEDNYFTLVNLFYAKRVLATNEKYYKRRIRHDSIMTTPKNEFSLKSLNTTLSLLRNMEEFKEFYSNSGILFDLFFKMLSMNDSNTILDKTTMNNLIKQNKSFLKNLNRKKYYSLYFKYEAKYLLKKLGLYKYISKFRRYN